MGAYIPEGTLKWAVVALMPMVMGLLLGVMMIQDDVDGFCVSNIDEAIEFCSLTF